MGKTIDLGRRIELQSMDQHCADMSVGLYQRLEDGTPQFLVHSYSAADGAREREEFLRQALLTMLGMEEAPGAPRWIRFPCHTVHQRALRRAFLDLTKLDTNADLTPKPLTAFDKKAGADLTAVNLGGGAYEMRAVEDVEASRKRVPALVRGYVKLCEMEVVEGTESQILFPCKTGHDALIGMLRFRAANVRGAMLEDEAAAARGSLAAPSQQK
jgi:hypothetical protein